MSYIFLTNPDRNECEFGKSRYYAISEGAIETLRVSETHSDFGNIVGSYNGGDTIELLSEKAVEIAKRVVEEQDAEYEFKIGDMVTGYDNSDVFDEIEAKFLVEDLVEGTDYNLSYETLEGFNYWDGHNWQTLVVSFENEGYTAWEIVSDEELIKELNEAIDSMDFHHESTGCKYYHSGQWQIEESFWQGHWEKYTIEELDEELIED